MPSPFPGIDPYIESQHLWEGFHARFVTYLCDALNDVLPEDRRHHSPLSTAQARRPRLG